MREQALLIELHMLPSADYFRLLARAGAVLLEACEHYPKQTCRNRYYINTAHGRMRLTVPVRVPEGRAGIRDVRLEAGLRWRNQHWRGIESAYRKAPFFEHYADELHRLFFDVSNHFLWEFNKKLLSFCLAQLHLSKSISETMAYAPVAAPDILDLRNRLSEQNPHVAGVFQPAVPYHQVFGSTFVAGCSVIDLLFCVGPRAVAHVRES